MSIFFRKTVFVALILGMVLAPLPVTGVFAMDEDPPQGDVSNGRLEAIWARQLRIFNRLGKAFDAKDIRLERLQE